MKITELRLAKLFTAKGMTTSLSPPQPVTSSSEKLKGATYIKVVFPLLLFRCFSDVFVFSLMF